jgi:hypothetical protein
LVRARNSRFGGQVTERKRKRPGDRVGEPWFDRGKRWLRSAVLARVVSPGKPGHAERSRPRSCREGREGGKCAFQGAVPRMEANETRISGGYDEAVPRVGSAEYQRQRRRRLRVQRTQICAGCRHAFTPTRRDARFCSGACRFKAHKARIVARAEAQRVRAIAERREAKEAAEVARKRADFIASLIG